MLNSILLLFNCSNDKLVILGIIYIMNKQVTQTDECNLINILTHKEINQSKSHTFRTFYLPFPGCRQTRISPGSIHSYPFGKSRHSFYCPECPELILSRLHAVCVRTLYSRNEHVQSRRRKLEGGSSSEEYQFLMNRFLAERDCGRAFEVYPLLGGKYQKDHQPIRGFSKRKCETVWKRIGKKSKKTYFTADPWEISQGIQDMAADCHCNGKCVKNRNGSGRYLPHKPRNAKTEKRISNCFNYFGEGIQLEGYTHGMVLREEYARIEWVSHRSEYAADSRQNGISGVWAFVFSKLLLGTGDLHS